MTASLNPLFASFKASGSVAFVKAKVEVRGTAPGNFRMAAFAQTLAALDAAASLGLPAGMLAAYAAAVSQTKQRSAADDSFGSALLTLLEKSPGSLWSGKAAELIGAAGLYAGIGDRDGPGWPRSPRRVPEVLNHLRDGLAELGVTWTTTTVRGSTRYYMTMRGTEVDQGVGFSDQSPPLNNQSPPQSPPLLTHGELPPWPQ